MEGHLPELTENQFMFIGFIMVIFIIFMASIMNKHSKKDNNKT
jgi:hypothetical protein